MEFTSADHAQVAKMQRAIAGTLAQFKDNTEAALAVAALMRCAKTLTRLYPQPRQEALIDGCVMFLKGETPDQETFILPVGGAGGIM